LTPPERRQFRSQKLQAINVKSAPSPQPIQCPVHPAPSCTDSHKARRRKSKRQNNGEFWPAPGDITFRTRQEETLAFNAPTLDKNCRLKASILSGRVKGTARSSLPRIAQVRPLKGGLKFDVWSYIMDVIWGVSNRYIRHDGSAAKQARIGHVFK
jgi:hypothetical protein